jgi:hypothetical protein
MKLEFERYGLRKYRKITGFFELLGGIGSAVGLFYPIVYQTSTLGLSILMIMGLIVRIRLKDKFLEALPALILAALNSYLFFLTF